MKILVTGANGFIGRAAIGLLVNQGHELWAMAKEDKGLFKDWPLAGFIAQDIRLPFTLDGKFDLVFHLAAYNITHVGQSNTDLYQQVNVEGTRHVIRAVKTTRFVFMSSAKMYAKQAGDIDEQTPLDIKDAYTQSKWEAEEICRQLLPAPQLIIFRAANIIGPGQPPKALVPVLLSKALAGEPLEIFGPRGSYLQPLDIRDLMSAFNSVIADQSLHGIFNLAGPLALRLDAVVEQIVKITASSAKVLYNNDEPMPVLRMSSQRFSSFTGWQPKINLRETLTACLP